MSQGSTPGSRTPINFKAAVESIFRVDLQGYTPVLSEVTSEYLLFGYAREARENEFLHVLVQGARTSGRIVTEVAVSCQDKFPYYRWSDEPKLAVAGVRERTLQLMTGQDHSYRYTSAEELTKVLRDLVVGQSAPALRNLGELAWPYLKREQQTWKPLYDAWVVAEDKARASGGRLRYPELVDEEQAMDLLQDQIMDRKYQHFLGGPLRARYRDPRYFNCHLYLFARGLEFLEPPSLPKPAEPERPAGDEAEISERQQQMATWAALLGPRPKREDDRKKELPPPLGDAIAGLTGRHPQGMCLELSLDPTVRHREYAFLKSLAAMEAYYEEPSR